MCILRAVQPHSAITNQKIREAAQKQLAQLIQERGTNVLSWADIASGFRVGGERILFANKPRGIFKPKQLTDGAALSVKQVKPSRAGRVQPYDDLDLGDGLTAYRPDRGDQDSHLLEEAHKRGIPIILFRGVADSTYEALFPVTVLRFNRAEREALLSFRGDELMTAPGIDVETVAEPIARSYSERLQRVRNHQRAFRQRVLLAYGLRCAITGLPVPELLEAAHILPDSREGEASVRNGLALSRLHHVAFERNLLGIDADLKIHIAGSLKRTKDGPLLKHGLLDWDGQLLRAPVFEGHRPSREFLAERFAEFQRTCS